MINNIALFHTKTHIAKSLTRLFNKIMKASTVPKSWKVSHITPILKKRDRSKVENYRPISLLSCLSKVLEKLVQKDLLDHLLQNNLLSCHQFGFLPGSSTLTRILDIANQAMDSKLFIKACFLDISKVFDRVWHAVL